MAEELKRYSIPWRKKLAKVYDFKEQYILDMTREEINALELGIAGGIAKCKSDIVANFDLIEKKKEESQENHTS